MTSVQNVDERRNVVTRNGIVRVNPRIVEGELSRNRFELLRSKRDAQKRLPVSRLAFGIVVLRRKRGKFGRAVNQPEAGHFVESDDAFRVAAIFALSPVGMFVVVERVRDVVLAWVVVEWRERRRDRAARRVVDGVRREAETRRLSVHVRVFKAAVRVWKSGELVDDEPTTGYRGAFGFGLIYFFTSWSVVRIRLCIGRHRQQVKLRRKGKRRGRSDNAASLPISSHVSAQVMTSLARDFVYIYNVQFTFVCVLDVRKAFTLSIFYGFS